MGLFALAAIVSPILGGWLTGVTGNWTLPFVASTVLMALDVCWHSACCRKRGLACRPVRRLIPYPIGTQSNVGFDGA